MEGARRDDGFSLVELVVIVVVIAVLIAIAIPTFFGSRDRASDRAAEARLDLARKAQMAALASGDGFKAPPDIEDEEPALEWAAMPADRKVEVAGVVYVQVEDDDTAVLAVRSTTGVCFWADLDKKAAETYEAPCVGSEGTVDTTVPAVTTTVVSGSETGGPPSTTPSGKVPGPKK